MSFFRNVSTNFLMKCGVSWMNPFLNCWQHNLASVEHQIWSIALIITGLYWNRHNHNRNDHEVSLNGANKKGRIFQDCNEAHATAWRFAYKFSLFKSDDKFYLHRFSGVKSLLGEPIKEIAYGSFEYGKPNFADDEQAYFEVKIKGPKARGTLFFWAKKEKDDKHWDVNRIEFQLGDDDSRRLNVVHSAEVNAPAA